MSGRNLRRRFRDDSPVATLMEIPTRAFVGLVAGWAVLAFVIAVVLDVVTGHPDLFVTALIPILLVVMFALMFWLSSRERMLRQRRLAQTSTAYQLSLLMPDEMADMAAELFRLKGYVVTENKRPDLSDGGVDFELTKDGETRLVQVKHWRHEVTVKEARELWGVVASERAAGAILIGTSGFTVVAREFAAQKDFTLIDGPEFMRLRSEVVPGQGGADGSDPMVAEGFAKHLAGIHRPACPKCSTPMVLVTRIEDTTIVRQFWGCKRCPECDGTRRLAFPYQSASRETRALVP